MKYYRKYKDESDWEMVSQEQVKIALSGAYVDVELAMETLHENGRMQTAFSVIKCNQE